MLPKLNPKGIFNWLDEFFDNDLVSGVSGFQKGVNLPGVNVKETEKTFVIEVAAPGVAKENLKLNIHNNLLTISSEEKKESKDCKENYMRREFCYTSFKRSFTLPENANTEKISAKHEAGILYITVEKKEKQEDEAKNIDIL